MELVFAPMEGITGGAFRRIHRQFFPGVDWYAMPFVAPNQNHVFSTRELRQIDPEENRGVPAVPQLLTRSAEDFLWAAGELAAMGYDEVNLNLGCPSGTVVAKGKGAGQLTDRLALDDFLEEIFSACPLTISVKTRLGLTDPEEFGPLLEIFSRYPLRRLIVHPRVREDHYRRPVRRESFEEIYRCYRGDLYFNGGITTAAEYEETARRWPGLAGMMMGQGLLANPGLAQQIREGKAVELDRLQGFHDALYDTYCGMFQSRRDAIYHMKELWRYLSRLFEEGERFQKKLRKVTDDGVYRQLVGELFAGGTLLPDAQADWCK